MGTDFKRLMENNSIREDFRFLVCKGVESIMEKSKRKLVKILKEIYFDYIYNWADVCF